MHEGVEGDHDDAAVEAGEQEHTEPVPAGQLHEDGAAEGGDLIEHQGAAGAQEDGAAAAVPVQLAEDGGDDAEDRHGGDGVGSRSGAGEVIEGGSQQHEYAAALGALDHGDQQDHCRGQVDAGAPDGDTAEDIVLDQQRRQAAEDIGHPPQQPQPLLLGHIELFQEVRTQRVLPEFRLTGPDLIDQAGQEAPGLGSASSCHMLTPECTGSG